MGAKTAPVVVMEFSDFHCPFCRRHATTVLPRLKRDYVDTGKVLYVFRHFPLDTHPDAPAAGAAAACAGRQGKFWEMHDRFFETAARVGPADLDTPCAAAGPGSGAVPRRASNVRAARTCARIRHSDSSSASRARRRSSSAPISGGSPWRPSRSISGADTYEAFAKAIDALLAR